MATAEKTLERMRNNPRDWRIEDLLTVAKRYKIKVRRGGSSHVHFYHEDMIEHISIPAHKPVKPVYVENFLKFLDAMNNPAAELRGISGMRTMISPPHPALSRKGRGSMVTPKQSFEESID